MNAEIKPMPLVNENATNILVREMGVVDTIRFLNQFSVGYGNYTVERRKIVDSMTLDGIFSGIEEMKHGGAKPINRGQTGSGMLFMPDLSPLYAYLPGHRNRHRIFA
jgi:hypothetical protein